MKKRNAYTKYLSYYVDENYTCGDEIIGGLPTPGDTMRYPLPVLWGKEPTKVNTYEALVDIADVNEELFKEATLAVFSFARSRKWNIGRLSILLDAELIDENFFIYHAEQLLKLFGNKNKYRTAMHEIERRCGVEPGFCCKF